MLERMGWTDGKGLGKNENGATKHVSLSFKAGSEGLGYTEKDNTSELCDNYEQVLSKLNAVTKQANQTQRQRKHRDEDDDGDDHEEHLVKKPRHRYGKLLRGKVIDASSCSQKDLACIFSSKDVILQQSSELAAQSEADTAVDESEKKKKKKKRKTNAPSVQ